jgi:hypothetical protein
MGAGGGTSSQQKLVLCAELVAAWGASWWESTPVVTRIMCGGSTLQLGAGASGMGWADVCLNGGGCVDIKQ